MAKYLSNDFFLIRILNKAIDLLRKNLNEVKGEVTFKAAETPHNIQARRVVQWFVDEGDKTHRLNYDLNESSFVVDLGGYEGQWASDIYGMYNCKVWIFEPYLKFANYIGKRFERNKKIRLFKFGLGDKDEFMELSIMDNSSSVFLNSDNKERIEIRSVEKFLLKYNITSVDLIKINIEGAEYELLESLLDKNMITIFKNIQVQFHDFIIANATQRMNYIKERLQVTHHLTYHYEFVWENWELKDD